MPKSKASNLIPDGQASLVDADAMGAIAGYSGQYINRMAKQGRVPWIGIKNGTKTYRRYSVATVLQALSHGVESAASPEQKAAPVSAAKPHAREAAEKKSAA
jgi:hypothetical protein